MNINRNNYEEFFLMYVDNELSAQEKNAVDAFLIANPDLQEELLMLQQSILIPDSSVFADKENLFRQGAIDSDMQQQLILMLDNELDKTTKEKLLGLTQKDATVKKEWELLQQTKLTDEEKIIFVDKASLYKKAGGHIVSVNWWRLAAAAIVIGFGVWGVFSYSNKSGSIQPAPAETVKVNPSTPAAPDVPAGKNEQPVITEENITSNDIAATPVNKTKDDIKIKTASSKKTNTPGVVVKQQPVILENAKDVAKQQETKNNNLPRPVSENINTASSNIIEVASVTPSEVRNNNSKKTGIVEPTEITAANQFSVQTTYIESENEEDNKGTKSKIGGFFKKLKRVVERKTNINSGDNNIRIANISFAVQ